MKIEKRISIILLILALFFLGCIHLEDEYQKKVDAPLEETIDIFNMDSIVNIINNSYREIGILPIESKELAFCPWLENYKNLVKNKILNSPNYKNQEFEIVGYVKYAKDEYFVEYNGCCELANEEEIPGRVQKLINQIPGCSIRKGNKFEPKSYSNCISKSHPNSKGASSLIQVWYHKK